LTTLPRPGDLVGGKYRVVRLIGEGGMGAVYEAHHEHLDSQVALKFLHPDLQASPALVARFLQEARVSASIKSPHVTHVIDVDQTPEGAAYLVMELLEGESLDSRMERQMPLPIAEAVDIGLQILSALEAAHARGVVHRDLKPDNVWLSPTPAGPYVKLLDFGIAKLKSTNEFREVNTRPGSVMGTPAYMAPEQAISADQVDGRADLYSFGVILYETLSGKRPVDSDDAREILEKLMRKEVRPLATQNPNVPAGLSALVDRLVSPNPDDRPASATQARTELVPHARASGMVWQADRLSLPVPDTVPPDDRGAPGFLPQAAPARLATVALSAKPKTAPMPAARELAFAPTAVATHRPGGATRRRVWPWVLLVFLVLAGSGFGVWAFFNPSFFEDGALPPLPGPGPLPSAVAAPVAPPVVEVQPTEPAVLPPVVRPAPPPAPRAPSPPVQTAPVGAGPSAAPTGTPPATAPTFPQFPFPLPFPIPSGLIPSSLPPFIPQIPGWTVPATPPGAPTAAPGVLPPAAGGGAASSPAPSTTGR
jgi:serine/threonine protein kinase